MESKPKRSIFQPDRFANYMTKSYTSCSGGSIGDFINMAIYDYFTPRNEELRAEAGSLIYKIQNGEDISEAELQGALSRSVYALRRHPVREWSVLDQIMQHFRTTVPRALRYDYITFIDEETDMRLHKLNEILKSEDPDYNLGMHELGERTRAVFAHWDRLCGYGEIYVCISDIIRLENVYRRLDAYNTLTYIRDLDHAITDCPAEPKAGRCPGELTLDQKIAGVRYEILVYMGDNGYAEISGDRDFRMPEDVREFYKDVRTTIRDERLPDEEYYSDLIRLRQKGQKIFRQLAIRKNIEKA